MSKLLITKGQDKALDEAVELAKLNNCFVSHSGNYCVYRKNPNGRKPIFLGRSQDTTNLLRLCKKLFKKVDAVVKT